MTSLKMSGLIMAIGQKVSLQCTIFGFCIFQSNKEEITFNFPVIPPLFHIVRLTLPIPVSCGFSHRVTSFRRALIFQFLAAKTLLRDELPCHDHNQCTFFNTCERISDRSSKIIKTVIAYNIDMPKIKSKQIKRP
jgi:hypothetical protein